MLHMYGVIIAGEYLATVKFNDQHIPDSPFKVQMAPGSGDVQKLMVQSLTEQGLQVTMGVGRMVALPR